MIKNQLKTAALLASLSGLILWMGGMIGGSQGVQVAFMIALFMNGIMYFFSDTIVLRLYNAKPLDPHEYAYIHLMVQELADKMGIPMPKLWQIQAHHPNAFATGRSPAHASVALTDSIITLLEPNELRGVLAHELSHVKNRDILVSTIAATLAATIGYLGDMVQRMLFWRALGADTRDRNKQSNWFGLLITAIVMPLIATLLQLAISRSREYLADECGAHYSRDPLALASALKKLQQQKPSASADYYQTSTASLFIVNPFLGSNWITLFATHPPTSKRIARLEEIFKKNF